MLFFQGGSSLKCSTHTRFCKANNLYLDLRKPRRSHERLVQFEVIRYKSYLGIDDGVLKLAVDYVTGTMRTSFRRVRLAATAG